jgi:uncharacterized protein (TIGR04442 family)
MLKDVRVHGAITPEIDFYATLAGEKLLSAPFYEMKEGSGGLEISFFLAGQSLHLSQEGVASAGTGGVVSEYMFGSPVPLQDLSHKEVRNRLVFFGAYVGDAGSLSFTANVSGYLPYETLFLDGNALCNYFFLVKAPWPYSTRRTQEVLLKKLGRVLKRSEHPGTGADSELLGEILKELAEPEAIVLLLRLVHLPHQRFYQFARDYYARTREWGEAQQALVAKLAEEVGVAEYQRERIAIDLLYKDGANKQIVDEYKDVLLSILAGGADPSAFARLNSLRNLALRHNLPSSLFDTLDQIIPASTALKEAEPDYLRGTREVFEGLFLASKPAAEVIGPQEVVRLLQFKQEAHERRDNGFEQILLDTGRVLDERAAQGGDLEPLEVFSNVVTFFDRLDNAEAVVHQLAFMEHATLTESKVRSLLGNKRAFEEVEKGLFRKLVVDPVLHNPYLLRAGRRKVATLLDGLGRLERGEMTVTQIVASVNALAQEEAAERHLYEGIRARLKQSYFNLSNPIHVRLLQREVEGELRKRGDWQGAVPPGAFATALDEVKNESEYMNNVLPRIVESQDAGDLREAFLRQSGLDRYRLEEIERDYRVAHGLEEPGLPGFNLGP